jgi:type IV pilus assembly protein PilE
MRSMQARHPRGFTLLELLVTLVIVATLAAISWPGYRQIMHRAQRIEARLALLKLQYLQERHFADHHVYAGALRADGDATSLPMRALTDEGNYELTLSLAPDAQAYVAVARASPTGRQAGDAHCQQLSINTEGYRRSANAAGIWRAEPGGGCWG